MPARWYRSLYWRIAVGFVLCLAAMLVVQALLLVYVASRSGPTLPGMPPDRFARAVAQDLGQALERTPALDLATYLSEQYGREGHPLVVLLADGREYRNGIGAAPDEMIAAIRERLRRGGFDRFDRFGPPDRFPGERRERPNRGDRSADNNPGEQPADNPRPPARPLMPPGPGDPNGSEGAPPFPGGRGGLFNGRPFRPIPVIVNDRVAGVVIVPPNAPFTFLLARYAPTLGVVAVGALVVGALLTTLLVFGPARRRLRDLEVAAGRLGAGDLTARAPEAGGDEVAAVATAFNAMADDLASRQQALETSDRVRRQLLADVSHELTTPVTAMRGYLETLTMPDFPIDNATRARYLGIVADETGRLERIIGDLLELARLEGGGGALAIETVPVSDLFARVCARHERTAAEAGVTFSVTVTHGAEAVRGDRDRLEQVLQNLAANALRYAPSGSTIELQARPVAGVAGAQVEVSVVDHGGGIAAEHLPHLFDRFYKAEASRVARPGGTSVTHGSGLGLSIVKAIVERHGGSVSVDSQPGRTAFTLRLPAVPPAQAA